MKICFLYNSVFTLGGIQTCITTLANYLIEKKYEVSIICTDSKTPINRNTYGLDKGIEIIFVKKPNIIKKVINKILKFFYKFKRKKYNEKILEFYYYFLYGKEIEKIINKNKFDIIISSDSHHNVLLSLLNINFGKKIAWQHHCYDRYFNLHYYNKDELIKKMFSNLDRYIVLIDDDKEKLKKFKGYDSTRIYNPTRFRQEVKSNLQNKKFIAVGRLNNLKGFDILIKNFKEFNKQNKEWTLDIYGEGVERENLIKLVKDLELTEYVKINHKAENIKQVYQEASIYCMSSRLEGFGMVVLEAMESGLPVISYNLPCIKEIIRDNEGVIVPYGADSEYVNAMLDLANNKQKRQEISKKAIERAKDFYIEQIGPQWEKVFNNLMN